VRLGPYPAVTLAQAREKARHARQRIDEGQDPILERERAQSLLRAEQASISSDARLTDELSAGLDALRFHVRPSIHAYSGVWLSSGCGRFAVSTCLPPS
jgi:hypothetical protein